MTSQACSQAECLLSLLPTHCQVSKLYYCAISPYIFSNPLHFCNINTHTRACVYKHSLECKMGSLMHPLKWFQLSDCNMIPAWLIMLLYCSYSVESCFRQSLFFFLVQNMNMNISKIKYWYILTIKMNQNQSFGTLKKCALKCHI